MNKNKDVTMPQPNKKVVPYEDFDLGFEGATAKSYAVPLLRVLQDGSPQCKKADGRYIKDAEAGMIYNTVTKEIYSGENGIIIIPCFYNEVWIEYIPRTQGGGFVALYQNEADAPKIIGKDENNRPLTEDGHNLIFTAQYYVLLAHGEDIFPCIIPMESSNLPISRNWMSFMKSLRKMHEGKLRSLAMFSNAYRATTLVRAKDQNIWYVWQIEKEGSSDQFLPIEVAKSFYLEFKTNMEKIVRETDYDAEIAT